VKSWWYPNLSFILILSHNTLPLALLPSNNSMKKQSIFTSSGNCCTTAYDRNTWQTLVVALLEGGYWSSFKRTIAIPTFVDAGRYLDENPAMFGANILHIALCNDPPVDIVESILQSFPETPFLADSVGRYPLHIASSLGLSTEIVVLIAKAYRHACLKQDLDGKTPLHFACSLELTLYEGEDIHPDNTKELNYSTIVSLVSIAPSAVHLVDSCDDMNPIELAILSNASSSIVSILQNISALEHMKKSGKLSEESVRRSLTRLKDLVSPFVLDWFKALIDA